MAETKQTQKPTWEPFRKYMECPQCSNKSFDTDHDSNGREIVICAECNYEDDYTGFCSDLITAAPELLEACKLSEAVLAEHEQYDDNDDDGPSRESEAAQACRAAIAKVEPQ